jgi:hypothetical protein
MGTAEFANTPNFARFHTLDASLDDTNFGVFEKSRSLQPKKQSRYRFSGSIAL